MGLSLSKIIGWLLLYKYVFLFPVSIFEGPIVTVLGGFLVSTGQMNFILVLLIVVAGDIVGDTLYYAVGRWGRHSFINRYGQYLGVTATRLERMETHFAKHTGKTLLLGKFSHAVGSVVLVAAGAAHVRYKKFILYNIVGTIPKSCILLLVGFYFGSAYEKINHYFDATAVILIVVACLLLLGYIVIAKVSKKLV
jgi:membrane protein DedA with SNARE-associated domain